MLLEELTLSDEELLTECFVFLTDLISEGTITAQLLPHLVAIIKLHTPTTSDQPHLPEPYQLLRIILFKSPSSLFDPLLRDLVSLAKHQLITTHSNQLRSIVKQISAVYLRNK